MIATIPEQWPFVSLLGATACISVSASSAKTCGISTPLSAVCGQEIADRRTSSYDISSYVGFLNLIPRSPETWHLKFLSSESLEDTTSTEIQTAML
jgi:hypothetical protein